jgi:ubiquinone biosynthesis protein UbiJ
VPAPLPFAALNHVLRQNSWALARLKPFAGKTARFDCPPFALALTVLDSGEVAAAAPGAAADVTIRFTPGTALRLAARDDAAWRDIAIDGDAAFAAAIDHVRREARWDAEEDLSRVFGDIAAHRLAEGGRTLADWSRQSADHLARSLVEYWTEERPLIAKARDVERFNRDVDALRDDVARLEKRIERLSAGRSGG